MNSSEHVSSYEKLGAIFGLHRASFPRIMRKHKDNPLLPRPRSNGDHKVSAWRIFFNKHPEIRRAAADTNKATKRRFNFCPQCGENLRAAEFMTINFCPQCGEKVAD